MKKRLKTAFVLFAGFLFLALALFVWRLWANRFHFWGGELMRPSEVCQRWGAAPFSAEKFKSNEDPLTRAKMACSLLKNQKMYIGKDSGEMRRILGDYSGHYFNEAFPTYFIQRGDRQKNQDAWQLVFLIDRHERIVKIVVHKNCCEP